VFADSALIEARLTQGAVVQRKANEKARPLQVGLFASFDNAVGQCHFARGPTLKTAQATG
jgi:hypothetical protein